MHNKRFNKLWRYSKYQWKKIVVKFDYAFDDVVSRGGLGSFWFGFCWFFTPNWPFRLGFLTEDFGKIKTYRNWNWSVDFQLHWSVWEHKAFKHQQTRINFRKRHKATSTFNKLQSTSKKRNEEKQVGYGWCLESLSLRTNWQLEG